MPRTGRRRPAAPTCIAPASSARTSGPKTSSATKASPRGSSASSAPWKPVPPSHSCPAPKRPQFVSRPRQQRVLYYYFLDPQFGLIHVRLQTWLPFTVQVYVNGHEWLAQQMVQKKLGFVQQHNAFTQLDDPVKAQRLPTASPSSTGRKSSTAGPSRSIRCSANCSPATPCIGSSIRPSTPPTCCSRVARPWPACTAPSWITRCAPSPPRTSWAFSAASGIAASTARCTPTTKTTAGSAPASSTA